MKDYTEALAEGPVEVAAYWQEWLQRVRPDTSYRIGPCDLCGFDHDDALSCDEAAAEYAAEKRAGVA